MLHNAAQAVSMGGNKYSLASLNLGCYLIVPEGQGPGNGVLEALTGRQLPRLQVCITPVLGTDTWTLVFAPWVALPRRLPAFQLPSTWPTLLMEV